MGTVLPQRPATPAPPVIDPARIEPGDLVLVRTPRLPYALGRALAGSPYDHVAVVVRGGMAVNIVKPAVVFTPLTRMLHPRRTPCVLRPQFSSEAARDAFVAELEGLRDQRYDLGRATTLILTSLLRRFTGIGVPLRPVAQDASRWICTDAVLSGLERHVEGFQVIRGLSLDWNVLHSSSTNDLVAISQEHPELLRVVSR